MRNVRYYIKYAAHLFIIAGRFPKDLTETEEYQARQYAKRITEKS